MKFTESTEVRQLRVVIHRNIRDMIYLFGLFSLIILFVGYTVVLSLDDWYYRRKKQGKWYEKN